MITPQLVRAVIEQRFRLTQLPLNVQLSDCDLNHNDLLQLRSELNKQFTKDALPTFSDTIYTLTDKLNEN